MPQRVNLDAMIPRADFGIQGEEFAHQLFKDFPIANLEETSSVRLLLRKPEFQRETYHWTPDQVATFIESFLENELIPSLILWKSASHIFIIDGGHRLSALRAWMADDYGDGAISINFYKGEIAEVQKKVAKRTRDLIESRIGRYTTLKALVGAENVTIKDKKRSSNLVTRALDLQWVQGNQDVAETSFFKINSQGTPLDAIEEMLLRHRRKAIAIASRSILRAGTGHKYWSKFNNDIQREIEGLAEEFHNILFDPESTSPITTIDLPLGGSVSPVDALALLIDFLEISSSRTGKSRNIEVDVPDEDGTDTIKVLRYAKEIAGRITGKSPESLGLHPAVYFYNERGIHNRHLFLGMASLITSKVMNNDGQFFKNFASVRQKLEDYLIKNKHIITLTFSNINRNTRVVRARDILNSLVNILIKNGAVTTEELLESIGYKGTILDIKGNVKGKVSDETKSAVLLNTSIIHSPKCPICNRLLHMSKSASYDHIQRVRDGGGSDLDNIQITHPYCNSAIKN